MTTDAEGVSAHEQPVGRPNPQRARTCDDGCNGCDECTAYPDGDWEPGDRWRCTECGHGWNAIDETERPRDECPNCGADGQGKQYVEMWTEGEPPRDGTEYEMRQVCSFSEAHTWTTWQAVGWWNGRLFVCRNQFRGGTDPLLFCTHWRRLKTPNRY